MKTKIKSASPDQNIIEHESGLKTRKVVDYSIPCNKEAWVCRQQVGDNGDCEGCKYAKYKFVQP